jgi:hypothetical protein
MVSCVLEKLEFLTVIEGLLKSIYPNPGTMNHRTCSNYGGSESSSIIYRNGWSESSLKPIANLRLSQVMSCRHVSIYMTKIVIGAPLLGVRVASWSHS